MYRMVDGELYKFLEKSYNGDLYYVIAFPDVRIGGLMPSRQTIPLSLIHPLRDRLEYALLEIGVVVPSEKIRWRVKVNGISVTKEFKPHAVSPSGDRLFAKLVYDVTSILKTPESIRRRRVNVTFKTEGSADILIRQIGLLTLYPTEEARTTVSFLSGSVSLKPGEKKAFETSYGESMGELKTVIYIPSKRVLGKIKINRSTIHEISNMQGIDEINLRLSDLSARNIIEIEHVETDEKYYPKELILSTILLYNRVYREPRLEIIEYSVPEIIPIAGGLLKIRVRNSGESIPDRALLIVMLHGNVIARKKLEKIPPGMDVDVDINVKLPEGEHDLVLRIVWNKLSKTYFTDKRIRVKAG